MFQSKRSIPDGFVGQSSSRAEYPLALKRAAQAAGTSKVAAPDEGMSTFRRTFEFRVPGLDTLAMRSLIAYGKQFAK